MSLWDFFLNSRAEVLGLTVEHLILVGLSTGIAVLIGVPLGIMLTRWPALSKPEGLR